MFMISGQANNFNDLNNYFDLNNNVANNEETIDKKRKIRNKFTPEEDQKLINLVHIHGTSSWKLVSTLMENRTQRQCRERWKHYLSCDLKEASKPWSKEEDKILMKKYNELGPKWTKIAKELPGRSDLQVKMRYFKYLKKDDEDAEIEFSENFSDFDMAQPEDNKKTKQEEKEKVNENIPFSADNLLSEADFSVVDFDFNFMPSNLVTELCQSNENELSMQSFENDISNWSFY